MHSKLPPKTQINLIKIPKYEYLESDMSLNAEFLYKRAKKMCICMCAGRQAWKTTSKYISVLTRHLLLTQLFPIIQEYLPLWNVFNFVKVRIQLTWWEIAYSDVQEIQGIAAEGKAPSPSFSCSANISWVSPCQPLAWVLVGRRQRKRSKKYPLPLRISHGKANPF